MKLKNKILNILKKNIFKLLNHFNLQLLHNKNTYIDLRNINNNYRLFLQYDKPIIVNLPISKAKWKAIPLSFTSTHPFVYSLNIATSNNTKELDAIKLKKELLNYYSLVQPKNMNECIGINVKELLPSPKTTHTTRWPWVDKKFSDKEFSPIYINKKINLLEIEKHGVQHWGPVSDEKLNTEVTKLTNLYNAIKKNGYIDDLCEKDGVIRGYILERDNLEWIWVPIQGQHRVSVASTLNLENVAVKVLAIYRECDITEFPLVKQNIYTKDEAKMAFNIFFEKVPRFPLLDNWFATINKDDNVK